MQKIKAVVLSDLDGTLLTNNGRDTHGSVHHEIDVARNKGVLFGIASFTSRVGIDQHLRHLEVRPNIYICEDGAYTVIPYRCFGKKYKDIIWHVNQNTVTVHKQNLYALQNMVITFAKETGIPAHLTHAASFMQQTPWVPQIKDVAIAIDTTRQLSFTMQIRKVATNKYCIDKKKDSQIRKVIRKILYEMFGSTKGLDYGPGWIDYAHPSLLKQFNKGTALRWLRQTIPSHIKIYFIGDGKNDKHGTKIPGIISIAVANANDVLKKNVNYVMTQNCTTGVVEALQLIVSKKI